MASMAARHCYGGGKRRARRPAGVLLGAIALLALLMAPFAAKAQAPANGPTRVGPPNSIVIPNYWDPNRRPEKPDTSRFGIIRFLTETDYPPFVYPSNDDVPTGFNTDLARAICEELKIQCTIQARRFDTLIESLEQNRGDAIIAAFAVTPDLRQRVDVSDRYYQSPARFAARLERDIAEVTPETLAGRKVGVVAGSAHAAFLGLFFPAAVAVPFETPQLAFDALKGGDIELVFADGFTLARWLGGPAAANCCAFRGGAFDESRFFGPGLSIAVRKGNDALRLALNYALFRLWDRGVYTELYLRHFPVGFH